MAGGDQAEAASIHPAVRPYSIAPYIWADKTGHFVSKAYGLVKRSTIRCVLQHELIHIRRFDGAAKLLLAAALCVHWFNPLVWVMYVLANRDLELSCDEAVVQSLGETGKSAYALALIAMEERKSGLLPFASGFSKNAMEERIRAIMRYQKRSVLTVFTTALFILFVTSVFATSTSSSVHISLEKSAASQASSATEAENGSSQPARTDPRESGAFQSLLALKTPEYQNKTVAAFDLALLDWANRNQSDTAGGYAALEKALRENSYPAFLSDKDRDFVSLTVRLSNTENSMQTRSYYSGKPATAPDVSMELGKGDPSLDTSAWASLTYGVSYRLDPDTVTVGQRDAAVSAVIGEVQRYWDSTAAEKLPKTEAEMRVTLEEIMESHSTPAIRLSFIENYYLYQTSSMLE